MKCSSVANARRTVYPSGRKSELRGINDHGKQQTKKSDSMFAFPKELRGKLWLGCRRTVNECNRAISTTILLGSWSIPCTLCVLWFKQSYIVLHRKRFTGRLFFHGGRR